MLGRGKSVCNVIGFIDPVGRIPGRIALCRTLAVLAGIETCLGISVSALGKGAAGGAHPPLLCQGPSGTRHWYLFLSRATSSFVIPKGDGQNSSFGQKMPRFFDVVLRPLGSCSHCPRLGMSPQLG